MLSLLAEDVKPLHSQIDMNGFIFCGPNCDMLAAYITKTNQLSELLIQCYNRSDELFVLCKIVSWISSMSVVWELEHIIVVTFDMISTSWLNQWQSLNCADNTGASEGNQRVP
ncbi:hypothetical protein PVAP13_4NG214233 [Panicum virgatum]|uniref:Uncharacterized protein n=1 Tax=Panicum virgatum TaxID=38727 RepID=A0A8T0TAR7_PANVG|nr:hypothetical protein PVAP13_4NG214233 [Panicum virgatum]